MDMFRRAGLVPPATPLTRVFGSGVGTNAIEFPQGVGIKLAAGSQLLLNLHLFNTADTALSGTSGTKILKVGIASIDDGGNPRSESIDQQAIPILEQEAMQAQGANIQGVSGASYTSAGFTQSLQSALHSLGFQ